ncbi:Carboxypeptidase G2 precursor [Stieleria maiorica]|uniref:Carboxypeptidase G2 n=1 Tax=Stieleria maiorica TaxID=2795974 RepID=A0A5B9MAD9_9BACT|nr:M20 family metallopeptidase [Stieleria maiorica]QEF97489.1 Carboxypeptidase G2 precursor [Stieleria maiorica]
MNQATAGKIFHWLTAHQDAMVALVREAVLIESPSADPSTQGPVFDLLASELQAIGFRCRRYRGKTSGGQLLAMPAQTRPNRHRQLLLGHCDTVWPIGTLERMPVQSRSGRLHGPGVYDMKAGLVQALFAMRALKELGMSPSVTPVMFINSDEEIGSSESAWRIERLARGVDRAMVMEPSLGPEGRLKTARKGVGRFVITITGRAAHAGLDPDKGISAILELSHVVQALHALNDPDAGTTVNVGTIDGGVRPNVVAAESRAEVDVRVRTEAIARQVEQAIHSLQPTVPGTEINVSGKIGRPPLEPTPRNRALWHRAQAAADALGIEIDEAAAGGGSDGNYTSLHTATLDGLGAVGDGAHALNEHVIEDKLPERAALLACLLLEKPITDRDLQPKDHAHDRSPMICSTDGATRRDET